MVTVRKPLSDGRGGGWKTKARVVCCGNFEPGSIGKNIQNRAEVPNTFEMRIMRALAAQEGWSLGSLDVKAAFLCAELDEEEGGVIIVQPPTILVRLGLAKPGVLWQLKKALYGLRCAPKRSGKKRGKTLEHQPITREAIEEVLQRQYAKNNRVVLSVEETKAVLNDFLVSNQISKRKFVK